MTRGARGEDEPSEVSVRTNGEKHQCFAREHHPSHGESSTADNSGSSTPVDRGRPEGEQVRDSGEDGG